MSGKAFRISVYSLGSRRGRRGRPLFLRVLTRFVTGWWGCRGTAFIYVRQPSVLFGKGTDTTAAAAPVDAHVKESTNEDYGRQSVPTRKYKDCLD